MANVLINVTINFLHIANFDHLRKFQQKTNQKLKIIDIRIFYEKYLKNDPKRLILTVIATSSHAKTDENFAIYYLKL